MGMTIDNAISAIEMVQTQLEITNQPRSLAFDTAISTMRKYKKIEQILDDCDLEAWEVLEKIKEVVKYGNKD